MTTALHTLLEHAERERNAALGLLLHAEENVRRLQQQAEQLHSYRDEYRLRQPGLGGRSVSIELLRSHHEFMQRLEQALQQQQAQLHNGEARLASRRTELLALETRVASVRKLMERRTQEERRRTARQEQRRSDDESQHLRGREGARSSPWAAASDALPVAH
jgi:flagellar FliJ protein